MSTAIRSGTPTPPDAHAEGGGPEFRTFIVPELGLLVAHTSRGVLLCRASPDGSAPVRVVRCDCVTGQRRVEDVPGRAFALAGDTTAPDPDGWVELLRGLWLDTIDGRPIE